jgi:hypothetical protein
MRIWKKTVVADLKVGLLSRRFCGDTRENYEEPQLILAGYVAYVLFIHLPNASIDIYRFNIVLSYVILNIIWKQV